MRKLIYSTAIILLLFFPIQGSAASLSISSWQANGHQKWRTSFPTAFSSTAVQRGASELFYPQAGTYLVGTYENTLSPKRTLRVEAGFAGSLNAALGSDTDWENEADTAKWYYGEFTAGGTSHFLNVDWSQKQSSHVEHFYGYSYRDNSFVMTNGIYYRINHVDQTPPSILTGLNSTYKMLYHGPHIGWRYTSSPAKHLSAVGSISYTPLAFVHGQGWWNLRELTFSHKGAGQMLDSSFGIRYSPSQNLSMAIGYRYQYHNLFRGWEDNNSDIAWDKATNIQQGFYFSALHKF